jgi:hypothetical protein
MRTLLSHVGRLPSGGAPRLLARKTRALAALTVCSALWPLAARAQLDPGAIRSIQGDRIEAASILGGDFGLAGASYRYDDKNTIDISKFGGAGDIGDPQPLFDSPIKWQPRLQGNMGYLTAKSTFRSGDLEGDTSKYYTYAIQFGGGARFWWGNHLSLAPTFMGMYGHTHENYVATSSTGQAAFQDAERAGLINWNVDTWTIRPSGQLAWVQDFGRTRITLASDGTYFHTEDFAGSDHHPSLKGDSETWKNLVDIDIPLGCELFGHELRTGGFFSRTEFYGHIEKGLQWDHEYELHARLVLDFLGELWKVQWLGIGASYVWGNNFDGYSFGVDAAFRF